MRIFIISMFLSFCFCVKAFGEASCSSAQSCVDAALPAVVDACKNSDSTCEKDTGYLYATATQLADRAWSSRACSSRESTSKFRGPCNACYRSAKTIFSVRFKFDVFHGLLAHASQILEARRKEICLSLPRSGGGNNDNDNGGNQTP